MEFHQTVEYIGSDDAPLYRGHTGRVFDASREEFGEVYVAFVNGPSLCRRPDDLRLIGEEEYRRRGQRLVRLLHPLDDRPIAAFASSGHEWPEA